MNRYFRMSFWILLVLTLTNIYSTFMTQLQINCHSASEGASPNVSAARSFTVNLSRTVSWKSDREKELMDLNTSGKIWSHKSQSLNNWTTKESAPISTKDATIEAYVIAFYRDEVESFEIRNMASDDITNKSIWFPALNGDDPKIIKGWLDMTRNWDWKENAATYIKDFADDPNQGPHAVGCYLSHWHLLRMMAQRDPTQRPDLLFIFEEDAACIPRLLERTMKIVASLPNDWDIFFIGGKPFTYFRNVTDPSFNRSEAEQLNALADDVRAKLLRKDTCSGRFGHGEGPLTPDGSRRISLDQAFWQTKYTTNLEAYVVNTNRINHILDVISSGIHSEYAIDVVYGDAMKNGDIKAYMPTMTFCTQGRNKIIEKPFPWEGYFVYYAVNETGVDSDVVYHWDELYFPECPGMY